MNHILYKDSSEQFLAVKLSNFPVQITQWVYTSISLRKLSESIALFFARHGAR